MEGRALVGGRGEGTTLVAIGSLTVQDPELHPGLSVQIIPF